MLNRFAPLSTPLVADACLRLGLPVRCGPADLVALERGQRIAGRVLPARHVGSVDVVLEAVATRATSGDVLVVDNGGRLDEACVGDLAILDAAAGGVSGVVVWGLHRDSAELREIGLPVFSLGARPTGPLRLDPRPDDALDVAWLGSERATAEDAIFGDDDGLVLVPLARVDDVLATAAEIAVTERRQAERIRAGASLRDQVRFDAFLAARARHPELSFRDHLRGVGGEIEV